MDTTLPNRLAAELIRAGRVRGFGRGWSVRREVRRGRSRFDLRLTRGREEAWAEVKSVTLVEKGIARFPDAPTVRGTRHVRELEQIALYGERALILFVVQRCDAHAVVPHSRMDPAFSRALVSARRAGVMLRAARFRLTPGGKARYVGPLPVRTP